MNMAMNWREIDMTLKDEMYWRHFLINQEFHNIL